ncbi:MAG: serine/threonine-protein kinase [Phycisphaerales bacterium]|nr:serine/threonine-protein kinase [Phycisphaerales bacterium]
MPVSRGQKVGKFNVLAKLGEGARSTIFAVQEPRTKQVWALKHTEKETEKDDRFFEQMEHEQQIGSKLDHISVRQVTKLIKHRTRMKISAMSLLMELVDGTTLDQKLPRGHSGAVKIFKQIADGLAHMHGRGFVHADIKPNNILITDDGGVKIIDLGQACAIGTVKKRIQGTPGYMAPEQAHRQAITPQTDIYNFGAMMYWVLIRECIPTAMPPKDANSSLFTGAVDASQIAKPVPPVQRNPRIHPLLSKQIMDCVELHPNDRPESMEFVANRLELIVDLLENPPKKPPPLVDDEDTVT